MPSIRRIKIADLHQVQNCNLWCLPENYNYKYYLYHYLNFSSQIAVAEENNQICGYALTKMDDDNEEPNAEDICGHITSLSILRTHRRLGLANKLMGYAHDSIDKIQGAAFVSLHVRVSNRAALGLYRDRLGYEVHLLEPEYYANGEDAYVMRKYFKRKSPSKEVPKEIVADVKKKKKR